MTFLRGKFFLTIRLCLLWTTLLRKNASIFELNEGALEISLYSLLNASFKVTFLFKIFSGGAFDGAGIDFGGDRGFGGCI